MAHAALVSLAQSINQILNHDHSPPTLPVYQEIIRSIRDHAVDLQSFLEGFPEKTTNSLEGRIREVADTAEDVIEYLLLERNSSDRGSFERQLKQVAEKIKSTAGDVLDYVKINDSVNNSVRRRWSNPFVVSSSSRRRELRGVYSVIGFNEDVKVIMDWLLMGSSKLQVLSIVGMGGIGKTTLVRFVFSNALIMDHFDFRFWVTISQDDSVESIVSKLLASMHERPAQIRSIPKEEEARQYLRDRRYLIVMDNVCSTKAWDDVRKIFPDDDNGSWIILTTRLQDVSDCTHSHKMRFLTLDHSWALLQHKVFGDHQLCPPEMESAGREIAARCGGLPLSIVIVGGLLSKIDKTNHVWKQIAESTDGQLETVMSLSYTHMPHHLKSCLLYLAAFPEFVGIHVSELTKLWVAEGFIKCRDESKSLEEEAEDYLEDLVQRGLVVVFKANFAGNIKFCRLHDTVRDFCIRQGGQERILVPVADYLPSPILRRHFLPRVLKNYKRLSVYSWYDLDLKDSMHSSRAHSIICLPEKGYRPKGFIQNFSLLRVLYVFPINDYYNWEPSRVFDLIYLTYLAANIPSSIVPPAISKLQNLQTLIIYRSYVRLPVEIWRLRQLRHLMAFSFHPLPQPEGATPPLENLQTLSLARDFVCSGRMVEMIPNIQRLEICYSEERYDEVYHIINLTRLLRLEKLKLEMDCSFRPHLNPFFPVSLKRLTLSGWGIPWRCMAIVGSLPNLQVLKLRKYACEGRCWKTSEGGFYALRMLLIDQSNLQHWKLTDQSSLFPNLECLVLHRCSYLSELPTALGHIPGLEWIEVDNRNPSLYWSAKMIQAEQWRNGNESLRVLVKDV